MSVHRSRMSPASRKFFPWVCSRGTSPEYLQVEHWGDRQPASQPAAPDKTSAVKSRLQTKRFRVGSAFRMVWPALANDSPDTKCSRTSGYEPRPSPVCPVHRASGLETTSNALVTSCTDGHKKQTYASSPPEKRDKSGGDQNSAVCPESVAKLQRLYLCSLLQTDCGLTGIIRQATCFRSDFPERI
jgi:hypothetical protein